MPSSLVGHNCGSVARRTDYGRIVDS